MTRRIRLQGTRTGHALDACRDAGPFTAGSRPDLQRLGRAERHRLGQTARVAECGVLGHAATQRLYTVGDALKWIGAR